VEAGWAWRGWFVRQRTLLFSGEQAAELAQYGVVAWKNFTNPLHGLAVCWLLQRMGCVTVTQIAESPGFDHEMVFAESRTLITSTCKKCGESRIVSTADGSLEGWEKGHACRASS